MARRAGLTTRTSGCCLNEYIMAVLHVLGEAQMLTRTTSSAAARFELFGIGKRLKTNVGENLYEDELQTSKLSQT